MITLAKGAYVISKRARKVWEVIDILDEYLVVKHNKHTKKIPFNKFNYSWEVYRDPDH